MWFGFCSFSEGQAGLKLGKVQQDIGTSTFLMPVLPELQNKVSENQRVMEISIKLLFKFSSTCLNLNFGLSCHCVGFYYMEFHENISIF